MATERALGDRFVADLVALRRAWRLVADGDDRFAVDLALHPPGAASASPAEQAPLVSLSRVRAPADGLLRAAKLQSAAALPAGVGCEQRLVLHGLAQRRSSCGRLPQVPAVLWPLHGRQLRHPRAASDAASASAAGEEQW